MAIIKQYHADTDTTYVYSSEYYWDPEKKQSRSRRRVIGKLDPETGEIIPTGKRKGRPRKGAEAETAAAAEAQNTAASSTQEDKDQIIRELKLALGRKEEQVRVLERENARYAAQIEKVQSQLQSCLDTISSLVKDPENER